VSLEYRCTGLTLHPGVCAAEKGADPWALRVSQENLELFQSQVCAADAHLLCKVLVRLVHSLAWGVTAMQPDLAVVQYRSLRWCAT